MVRDTKNIKNLLKDFLYVAVGVVLAVLALAVYGSTAITIIGAFAFCYAVLDVGFKMVGSNKDNTENLSSAQLDIVSSIKSNFMDHPVSFTLALLSLLAVTVPLVLPASPLLIPAIGLISFICGCIVAIAAVYALAKFSYTLYNLRTDEVINYSNKQDIVAAISDSKVDGVSREKVEVSAEAEADIFTTSKDVAGNVDDFHKVEDQAGGVVLDKHILARNKENEADSIGSKNMIFRKDGDNSSSSEDIASDDDGDNSSSSEDIASDDDGDNSSFSEDVTSDDDGESEGTHP